MSSPTNITTTAVRIFIFLFLGLLAGTAGAFGQTFTTAGSVVDSATHRPVSGATVTLTSLRDTTVKHSTSTDATGNFTISSIRAGNFRLRISSVGFREIQKSITLRNAGDNIGALTMVQKPIVLGGLDVVGEAPPVVQNKDTTEYNASAFKTSKDATAEDLVTKMPGVVVTNGSVQAQGETVQQVLVDGRPFFGADPTLALRNMPPEVIDKVQVFDKLSDQAQLTGFDDGNSVKTMNIVTRRDRRQGQFGKASGGYGSDDRYSTSGAVNFFNNDERISLIGLSNNVNQQNFSVQDLLGVMSGGNQGPGGPGGGGFGGGGNRQRNPGGGGFQMGGGGGPGGNSIGNFLVNQQSGVASVNSAGVNVADSVGGTLYANGSYFFNYSDNDNPQTIRRQYLLSQDSTSLYNAQNQAEVKNFNHRVNIRAEYSPDTSNSFIFTPQLLFQRNRSTTALTGINTTFADSFISEAQNTNPVLTYGYNLGGHIVFRHKFSTPGRSVSIDVGATGNQKNSSTSLSSTDTYAPPSNVNDTTINQQTTGSTDGYTVSSNIAYTEPLWSNSLLQISYAPSYTKNTSNSRVFSLDQTAGLFDLLDTALSNSFDNTYVTENGGLSYRLRGSSFNFMAGLSYQISELHGQETYPTSVLTEKTFYTLLPNAMLNIQLSNRRSSLRMFYRASTAAPSISQLQDVVDNSNPLFLTTGNPNLQQSVTHSLLTRITLASPENAQSLMLFLYGAFTRSYIGNSTIVALHDTVLPGNIPGDPRDNIRLSTGAQITSPMNLDGYWNGRAFVTYGFPIGLIKSNLNVNGGFTFTRTPGMVNNQLNDANVFALSPGFVLGSNISEDFDFTLAYSPAYNIARNTLQSSLDNNYFTHTATVRVSTLFWEGIVIRSDLSHNLTSGLGSGLDENILIWNATVGKKLFANQQGEIALTVYDILNQNRSITRTITDTYTQDATSKVLTRYVLLTFSYALRQYQPPRNEFGG